MANISAIHSVGASIVTYLRNAYPAALRAAHPCDFRLVSCGELAAEEDFGTALTFFLHRVTINEHLRTQGRLRDRADEKVPLAVDLHYLMSVWATSALTEQTVLCWAMRELQMHPVLDSASLSPEANWNQSDVVQIIPAELSNEDIMRIWDAITPSFRISVSYIARVVRIDPDSIPEARPVVASRFAWTDREAQP